MYYSSMSNEIKTKTTMYLPNSLLKQAKQIMLNKEGKINLSALVESLLSDFCSKSPK